MRCSELLRASRQLLFLVRARLVRVTFFRSSYVFTSPYHAATAPRSAVAELEVVRPLMTPTLLRTVLFFLFATTVFAADKKAAHKEPDPNQRLTKGRGQYAFPSGATLRLTNTKDGALILSSGSQELHRLARGSTVGQVLTSPDHRTILFLVTTSTLVETPKSSDVTMALVASNGILRLHSDRKDRITCTTHMADAQLPKELQAMSIVFLDSVLNDGFTVQMQVIRTFDDPAEHPSGSAEEVWDLETHQRLKIYEDYTDSE